LPLSAWQFWQSQVVVGRKPIAITLGRHRRLSLTFFTSILISDTPKGLPKASHISRVFVSKGVSLLVDVLKQILKKTENFWNFINQASIIM
jgi:hypothetical protein